MIRKFVTVYPGHIDLPDMGQDATPANERRYSNEQLASVFEKTEADRQDAWTGSASTRCGWPSTTSSTRATRSSPTSSCWPCTWRT